MSIKADLGGRRGKITAENTSTLPYAAFRQIKAYDGSNNLIKTYTVNAKNGESYYNVYEKDDKIKKLEITLTSDREGTTTISSTRTLYIEDIYLPPVFM